MKILRVAQNLYPEVPGGGPYHVHAMSRDQAAMGHDVTVLTVTDDNSLPQREEHNGYTVVRQSPTIELLGNDISAGVAKDLALAREYDIIHAHSHLYFSTNLAALKRRLDDIPLAITNHGIYSQTAPEWVFDAYLKTVGRWTFDSADVVFCYTEEDKERIRRFGVKTDIEVVANGIDQTRFTPDGPQSQLVTGNGPVVLFVGRLVEGKRPGDALEAFAGVRETYPDAKLYLCGDGPLRSELEESVQDRGLFESVTFLGHVAYDEMPPIYRSADVLILPSRAEGLPRVVLEAFASGTPVVASELEQIVPIVEVAGATVAVGDVEGFERSIISLLSADDYEQRCRDGRKLVEDQFQWRKTAQDTTEILSGLLGNQ